MLRVCFRVLGWSPDIVSMEPPRRSAEEALRALARGPEPDAVVSSEARVLEALRSGRSAVPVVTESARAHLLTNFSPCVQRL